MQREDIDDIRIMTSKQGCERPVSGRSHCSRAVLRFAAGQYGPGASDTEIKIGNTMPYSGPASAYGAIGKAEAAYFNMINEQGGINGRKINFISRDDGYSPPKTVEQVRTAGRARPGAVSVQSRSARRPTPPSRLI